MIDDDTLPIALRDALPPESERWQEYERRKAAWMRENPGAWPAEIESTCARFAEELGL